MANFYDLWSSLEVGFPVLAMHTLTSLVLLFLLTWVYNFATHGRTLPEIARHDLATAVSSGSVMLSFAIPLSFCLASSLSTLDIIVWSIPLGLIQIAIFYILESIFSVYPKKPVREVMSIAIYIAFLRVSVSIILAGAIMD